MSVGEGSITLSIGALKAGSEDAARALLDRYLGEMEDYARRKLRRLGASRAVADEQDVAQEALLTVIDGLRNRKFDHLKDRDDLIKLLRFVTWRGAIKIKRHQEAARRADRPGEAARRWAVAAAPAEDAAGTAGFDPGPGDDRGAAQVEGLRWDYRAEEALAQIAGRERDPRELVAIREEFGAVLAILADERDRHLLLLKLEGYSQAEIAERFDCCKRTVNLRYRRVRETLLKRAPGAGRPIEALGRGRGDRPRIEDALGDPGPAVPPDDDHASSK
jgi:RNA polymerase sigma factor (sigma-70 family)